MDSRQGAWGPRTPMGPTSCHQGDYWFCWRRNPTGSQVLLLVALVRVAPSELLRATMDPLLLLESLEREVHIVPRQAGLHAREQRFQEAGQQSVKGSSWKSCESCSLSARPRASAHLSWTSIAGCHSWHLPPRGPAAREFPFRLGRPGEVLPQQSSPGPGATRSRFPVSQRNTQGHSFSWQGPRRSELRLRYHARLRWIPSRPGWPVVRRRKPAGLRPAEPRQTGCRA